ncbi:hypothetical protein [Methylobacterium brachythecii]|uniref:Uncharacterized protein n=1 Tax=Methylobacterium brachythecii TaxID=1176177 RepID=A0A7W6F8J2_9HYPH|nr:hypothetical protein [Methylobacterium brachythecii]MBB3904161.1 hypothetical protein [Methylobacterium brachythecii]GLS45177.1 hypothetical protein GCM10007884_31660 [Methylobacterium brachythecii]
MLKAMWIRLLGREPSIATQQQRASEALAVERETTRRLISEIEDEAQGLYGAEARMRHAFAGLQVNTGRARRGQH